MYMNFLENFRNMFTLPRLQHFASKSSELIKEESQNETKNNMKNWFYKVKITWIFVK